METKTFSVVTSISTILTVTVATLSIIDIAIIGLYLGIIVLFLLALIPIASKFYAKKMISKCNVFQRKYYTTFTIINSLSILVVFAMTFVILVDRVFPIILNSNCMIARITIFAYGNFLWGTNLHVFVNHINSIPTREICDVKII